jgi:hypothetical protein
MSAIEGGNVDSGLIPGYLSSMTRSESHQHPHVNGMRKKPGSDLQERGRESRKAREDLPALIA